MATVDELLATMAEDGIAHDDDICFADQDTRVVNIPKRLKIIGVENDDDVVVRRFCVPAICCGTDLSTFEIRVNFENAKKEKDCYYVTDAVADGDYITFSWLVDRKALRYKGMLRFAIHMELLDADGYIEKEWNTTPAHFDVLEGLEVELTEEEEEAARAAATQLVRLLEKEGENQAAAIAAAGAETIASIPEDYTALAGAVDKNAQESAGNGLRRSYDGTTRLSTQLFIHGTIITAASSDKQGSVAPSYTWRVVTEDIQTFAVDVMLAVKEYPYRINVVTYDETDAFVSHTELTRAEIKITAGTRFRVVIERSDMSTGTADIDTFVDNLQVLSVQQAPNTVVTEGALNAMLQLAEEYFLWAYDGSMPLIYAGAADDNSHWSDTLDSGAQYTLNCSGFVNTLLQGVHLSGSRFKQGADAANRHAPWAYAFDGTVRGYGVGGMLGHAMYRYAEAHGFGYIINDDFSNVRPGDVLYKVDFAEQPSHYRGIVHCVLCLANDPINGYVSIIHCASTTDNPVGLATVNMSYSTMINSAYRYGARFPMGDSGIGAEIVACNDVVTDNAVALDPIGKGIYTIIVKGDCSARPRFAFTPEGGTEDWLTMLQCDDDTYALIRYVDKPTTALRIMPASDENTFDIKWAAVYHGYASPYCDYRDQHQIYSIKKALKQQGIEI